jgi:hypothetical protein
MLFSFHGFSPSEFLLPQQYDERQGRFRTFPLRFFIMPPFLLSKSLELVRIEQEPVRVFASVQFHRRFEFNKRGQLLIDVHNETLSVVAVRVSNADRSPVGING